MQHQEINEQGEQEQAENDAFDALACVMRIEAHQPAPGSLHRRSRGRDSFIGVGAMRILIRPHIAGLDPNPRGERQ